MGNFKKLNIISIAVIGMLLITVFLGESNIIKASSRLEDKFYKQLEILDKFKYKDYEKITSLERTHQVITIDIFNKSKRKSVNPSNMNFIYKNCEEGKVILLSVYVLDDGVEVKDQWNYTSGYDRKLHNNESRNSYINKLNNQGVMSCNFAVDSIFYNITVLSSLDSEEDSLKPLNEMVEFSDSLYEYIN